MIRFRFVAAVCAALCQVVPGIAPAAAQPAPQATPVALPILPPEVPVNPYAKAAIDIVTGIVRSRLQSEIRNDADHAEGDVTYFKRFDLQLRIATNSYRNVHLHPGTEIDPRGSTIEPGERVRIGGLSQADGSLAADAITILH